MQQRSQKTDEEKIAELVTHRLNGDVLAGTKMQFFAMNDRQMIWELEVSQSWSNTDGVFAVDIPGEAHERLKPMCMLRAMDHKGIVYEIEGEVAGTRLTSHITVARLIIREL